MTARQALARRVDRMNPARHLRFRRAFAELEKTLPHDRPVVIADVGCEDGTLGRHLGPRHPNWTIVGFDLEHESLVKADRAAKAEGVANAAFCRLDVTKPMRPERFDAVVALESVNQIPDDAAAFGAFAHLLRPGGRLVLHVPEAAWRPVLAGSPSSWRNQARHGYAPADLRRLAQDAGLAIDRIQPTTHAPVHLAEELTYRVRSRGLRARGPVWAFGRLAAAAERAGLKPGRPRALLVTGHRP